MTKEVAIQMLRLYEVNEVGEGKLETWYNGIDKDMREALDMAIEALSDKPKGEWIDSRDTDTPWNDGFKCSACKSNSLIRYNFCPNCGARMKGGDTE